MIPLGRLIDVNPQTPEFENDPDASVTFMPLECVWPDGRADTSRRATASAVASGYTRFRNGDILLPKITPTFEAGRVCIAQLETPVGAGTTELHTLRVNLGVEARYIAYLCRSQPFLQDGATRLQGVGNLRRVPSEFVSRFPVAITSAFEQVAIADFLDRETAKIDTLIAKQEQLIETLRERRQASIDEAFRPAGPETYAQLRRAITFLTSGSRGWGDYYAGHGDRFVRIGNLPRATLSLRGEVQHIELPDGVTEGARTRLHEGDLLFSITAYLGSVAVVDTAWAGAYVSQHVALCRLDVERLDSRYAGYYMLSTPGQQQLKAGAYGGTKLQLALDDIRTLVVPFQSLETQREIYVRLDEQTAQVDALITKADEFITLAKERRAALITAAVTGQIDVSKAA